MFLFPKENFYLGMFLSFAFVYYGYAMEQAETDKTQIIVPSILHKKLFSCTQFPEDIAGHIIRHFFTSDLADSYGKQLQTFALINKNNGALVSAIPKDAQALRKFIHDVSFHFGCSNEKIGKSLPWKSAREIMKLQNDVLTLCHKPFNITWEDCNDYHKEAFLKWHCEWGRIQKLLAVVTPERIAQYSKNDRSLDRNVHVWLLEQFCKEGANLDFTHGQDCTTPFMALCASSNGGSGHNSDVLRQLRRFFVDQHQKKLVDLNKVNSEGKNGFMISCAACTRWVLNEFSVGRTFDPQTLKPLKEEIWDIKYIDLNHQDNDGDTALHFYFNNSCNIHNIGVLIVAGVDPEIKNNKGVTPRELLAQFAQGDDDFKAAHEYLKQIMERKNSHEKA